MSTLLTGQTRRVLKTADYALYLFKVVAVLALVILIIVAAVLEPLVDPQSRNVGLWQRVVEYGKVGSFFALVLLVAVYLQRRIRSKLEEADVLS